MSKKQQKKGTTMHLTDFLQADEFGSSWADDVDLPSAPVMDATAPLPSGPSRGPREDNRDYRGRGDRQERERPQVVFPTVPPFVAFVGGLSYEVAERDLMTFFGEEKVENVRIPTNEENKPKGFAYVEFVDAISLKSALEQDGQTLQGRRVRVDLADQKKSDHRQRGGFRDRAPPADDRTTGNWRMNQRPLSPPRNNGGFGGGRGFERSEKPAWSGGAFKRDGPGFGDREDRPPREPRGPPSSRADSDRSWRTHAEPKEGEPVPPTAPTSFKDRPPRTQRPAAPQKPKVDPFGGAAPKDETVEALKRVEERLAKEEEERKARLAKEKEQQSEERGRSEETLKPEETNERLDENEKRSTSRRRSADRGGFRGRGRGRGGFSRREEDAPASKADQGPWRRSAPTNTDDSESAPESGPRSFRGRGGFRRGGDRSSAPQKAWGKTSTSQAAEDADGFVSTQRRSTTTKGDKGKNVTVEEPAAVKVKNAFELLSMADNEDEE